MSEVAANATAAEILQQAAAGEPARFSFEYYPPRTAKGVENLRRRLKLMRSWGCEWMDVTWGAGGTTSELTPELCDFIQNDVKAPAMMHLTCTNMEPKKIDEALAKAAKSNIRNILALRGDPPAGETEWKAIDTGFSCALDLIRYIKGKHQDKFGITCAGYPEGHPNVRKKIKLSCTSWDRERNEPRFWAPRLDEDGDWEGVSEADWRTELQYLKQKVQAGADVIITQLFYDAQVFLDFVRAARQAGITAPILPGIMPILRLGSFKRMTSLCRTVVPPKLADALAACEGDDAEVAKVGMGWVVAMLKQVLAAKDVAVPGLHLYTMNTDYAPAKILLALGLGPTEALLAHVRAAEAKQAAKKAAAAEKAAAEKKAMAVAQSWKPMTSFG